MTHSKSYRFLRGAVLCVFLSAFVVYSVKSGYVQAVGGAKILLSLIGIMFLVASIVGSVMVFRGRIRMAEQYRPLAYVAFLMLAVGGVTGLWAGLPLDRLPAEWSTVGIYLTAINLILMFVVLPICTYWLWRQQRR